MHFEPRNKIKNEQWEDLNKLEMTEIYANIEEGKCTVRIINYEDKSITICPLTVIGEVMQVEIHEPDMEGVKLYAKIIINEKRL